MSKTKLNQNLSKMQNQKSTNDFVVETKFTDNSNLQADYQDQVIRRRSELMEDPNELSKLQGKTRWSGVLELEKCSIPNESDTGLQ